MSAKFNFIFNVYIVQKDASTCATLIGEGRVEAQRKVGEKKVSNFLPPAGQGALFAAKLH